MGGITRRKLEATLGKNTRPSLKKTNKAKRTQVVEHWRP
jgi:hypothetical protein